MDIRDIKATVYGVWDRKQWYIWEATVALYNRSKDIPDLRKSSDDGLGGVLRFIEEEERSKKEEGSV
jgi:hypothetical protein